MTLTCLKFMKPSHLQSFILKEFLKTLDKLNVNGGCIALGHPMGATGSIMMSTLLDEMERQNFSGIVSTSGAAGAGTAILIER